MCINFRLNYDNKLSGTLNIQIQNPCDPVLQTTQSTQHSLKQKNENSELEVNFFNHMNYTK